MISKRFIGLIKRLGSEDVNIPLPVTLSYDAGVDPFAVQALFEDDTPDGTAWLLDRDLLAEGISSLEPVGAGDVKFKYLGLGTGCLMMCLKSPQGHADIALPAGMVRWFLDATEELAEQAQGGDLGGAVDAFLKDVFEA